MGAPSNFLPQGSITHNPGFWPNFALNLYPDGINVERFEPIGPRRTRLRYSYAFASGQVDPDTDITERVSADIAQRYQIETAPPAPPTSGALYEPIESGRGVAGGVRERMAAEDAVRGR